MALAERGIFPEARKDRLVSKRVADELLVYDLDRHKAYCLNPTAALVFERCDGRTTIPELAERLRDAVEGAGDEGLVQLTLDQLEKAELLRSAGAARLPGATRRELLVKARQLGLSLLLPAVVCIVAPSRAAALSACTGTPDCPGGTPQCTMCGTACDMWCSGTGSGPGPCRTQAMAGC